MTRITALPLRNRLVRGLHVFVSVAGDQSCFLTDMNVIRSSTTPLNSNEPWRRVRELLPVQWALSGACVLVACGFVIAFFVDRRRSQIKDKSWRLWGVDGQGYIYFFMKPLFALSPVLQAIRASWLLL